MLLPIIIDSQVWGSPNTQEKKSMINPAIKLSTGTFISLYKASKWK